MGMSDRDDAPAWLVYHDATRYGELPERIPREAWPAEWVHVDHKTYPGAPRVSLPHRTLPPVELEAVLRQRQTTRSFADVPLPLDRLARVLEYAAGIRRPDGPDIGNRYYPSAGARYPLEVYVVARRIEGLKPGVYHYAIRHHVLEGLGTGNAKSLFGSLADDWMRDAAVLVIVTALFERNFRKYGQRGYRDVLIEAGHLGQNLALVSASVGLGWCGIGAYLDDFVNHALGVDGVEETVIAVHAVGVPAPEVGVGRA
jgi:SagB-type dehydrogenase family enzyme